MLKKRRFLYFNDKKRIVVCINQISTDMKKRKSQIPKNQGGFVTFLDQGVYYV